MQAHRAHEASDGRVMRSMLFVPGDRPERFAKADASGADAVILDLEDAVAPERRPLARTETARWLQAGARTVPTWVRINPVATDDALVDLAAVLGGRPDGIVLPKARHGDDVRRADHWLEALEARLGFPRGRIGLLPLITESAGALLNAGSFTSLPGRVTGLTWGAEDLAADVGASTNKAADGEYELTYALARTFCLLASAAAGVAAFDTVDTAGRTDPRRIHPDGRRDCASGARDRGLRGRTWRRHRGLRGRHARQASSAPGRARHRCGAPRLKQGRTP